MPDEKTADAFWLDLEEYPPVLGIQMLVAHRIGVLHAVLGIAMLSDIGWWDLDRNCLLPWVPEYWSPIAVLPNMASAAPDAE